MFHLPQSYLQERTSKEQGLMVRAPTEGKVEAIQGFAAASAVIPVHRGRLYLAAVLEIEA